MNYDVFNGDADGIISLLQLRLASPEQCHLITGVKRDISLLKQVPVEQASKATVLDISMEKNITSLESLLAKGVSVFYADHHRCGPVPNNKRLDAHIDLDANTCTALIIDKLLSGQFHFWAITAAYGDNLIAVGDQMCAAAELTAEQAEQLKELGTLINYNGYGSDVADLHYHPAELYTALLEYPSPFDVIADKNSPFYVLRQAYEDDMKYALAVNAQYTGDQLSVFELPNAAWARRISGVYGNLLANQSPEKAHAVLTENIYGSYTLSLRAPLSNKHGAGDICSQFDTGGGRAAAAGVNELAKDEVMRFISVTEQYYREV